MQTQDNTKQPSSLERRIDMSVPVSDIDQAVQARLRKLSRTVKMSGFRPGKVPFRLIEQQYGPQVRSEVIGDAVGKAFGDRLTQENMRIAGMPRFEPKGGADAAVLEFSAVFEVYPEVSLGAIHERRIERPTLEVGPAEVERTIEVLRKQRTTFVEVDRAAAPEDRVVMDFTGWIDGEVFQGGQASDFVALLGRGSMLPDFESQVTGMAAGELRSFDVAFPADYHAKELAGKTARFDVTLKRVEEPRLPDVDAEFARSLGISDGDLERMRVEVRANLEREVKKRLRTRVKEQVMKILLEANPIEVPRALVEDEARQLSENAINDLRQRGIDPKNIGMNAGWFGEPAERRVKLGLILAEIVKANGLHAKPEQIRAMVDDLAQSYEDPSEVVRWYYAQRQQLAQVEALVVEDNVVDWVIETAQTVDKPIDFDELMGAAA
jgi:trigger factor